MNTLPKRLFIGCYPTGLVYADREIEEHRDYRRLAYINYASLNLKLESDVPQDCLEYIKQDHQRLLAMKGQQLQISSSGQCVTLGLSSGHAHHPPLLKGAHHDQH